MSCPSLRLTPHGHLVLEQSADAAELDDRIVARLTGAFARGSGFGLLQLGAGEVGQIPPPVFLWWRRFASRYMAGLCLQSSDPDASGVPNIIEAGDGRFRSKVPGQGNDASKAPTSG